MAHVGVTCDGCGLRNFTGVRYKCQSCFDYDLCHNCMINGITTKDHYTSHAMKSIVAPGGELDLYFGDSLKKKKKSRYEYAEDEDEEVDEEEEEEEDQISPRDVLGTGEKTYSCPYCARIGYTEQLLVNHVVSDHAEEDKPVVCPICAARPGGDPNYVSRDFHGHINLRHGGNKTKKAIKGKGKGKAKTSTSLRGSRRLRRSGSSELGLSAEKSKKDRSRKKGEEGPLFEQEKPELTNEEKEEQYNNQMMRAIFMQQMIISTLLPEDS